MRGADCCSGGHMENREHCMSLALSLAREAYDNDEVPVGCVITDKDGRVIGRGRNRREESGDATAHAEIEAIREACANIHDWRLEDCTMYVTLEPCQMCAGAIVQARMKRVVIGSRNAKAGCAGSVLNLLKEERFNHQVELTEGILKEECAELLSSFFKRLRRTKALEKSS